MSGRTRVLCWLGPLLSGGLLTLAYPGWNVEWLVWLWLIPLLIVLWPLKSLGFQVSGFKLGYLAGLAFFLPNLWWVRHSARVMLGGAVDSTWVGWGPELLGLAALIGLAGYCALYIGLWAWFVGRFAKPNVITLTRDAWWPSSLHSLRCASLAAAAWVACEWLERAWRCLSSQCGTHSGGGSGGGDGFVVSAGLCDLYGLECRDAAGVCISRAGDLPLALGFHCGLGADFGLWRLWDAQAE
jgi:hypothetical protein